MQLVYFSPVPARSYAQRPHYFVQACLARGVRRVLWVDPYPCRLPRLADVRRPREGNQGTTLDERIEIVRPAALPIEPLPGGPWFNRAVMGTAAVRRIAAFVAADECTIGVGRPCALAHWTLKRLRPAASFYDAMDNFPEFYSGLSRRALVRTEDAIARRVDRVIASSTFLVETFAARGLQVAHVPNAYPMWMLPPWSPPPPQRSQPVLGYVGCLGPWFDWPLVVRIAEECSDARIELVGPRAAPVPRRLPANVALLGACNQAEAIEHVRRFSAGLIPFQRNALTAAVDPIKFYEYRAQGLPVLSTQFGEMARRGPRDGVYFLDSGQPLRQIVATALAHAADAEQVVRFRRENDWAARWDAVPWLGPLRRAA